jgi:succinate dehydrogenase / fumarate reductase flavoprotein subunit
VQLTHKPLPKMRPELLTLFDRSEMSKYLTDEELAEFDQAAAAAGKDEK